MFVGNNLYPAGFFGKNKINTCIHEMKNLKKTVLGLAVVFTLSSLVSVASAQTATGSAGSSVVTKPSTTKTANPFLKKKTTPKWDAKKMSKLVKMYAAKYRKPIHKPMMRRK